MEPNMTSDPRGILRKIKTIAKSSDAMLITFDCGHVSPLGISVQAQDMVFNESSAMMFSDLHYTEPGA